MRAGVSGQHMIMAFMSFVICDSHRSGDDEEVVWRRRGHEPPERHSIDVAVQLY